MPLIHALKQEQYQPRFRIGRRRKRRRRLVDAVDIEQAKRRRLMLEGVGLVGGVVAMSAFSIVLVQTLLPAGAIPQLVVAAQTNPLASVAFGVAAVLLPAVFVSQTLMTVSSGFLFGAKAGVVIAITAHTLSALIAYAIGTKLSQHTRLGDRLMDRMQPYIGRLRENAFEGVLFTRIIYFPHEVVSYAAGMLGIGWKPLALGTLIGSLPSTFFLVQAGAGISSGLFGTVSFFSPSLFIVSGGMLAGSVIVARQLRQRESNTSDIIEGEIIEELPPASA